MLKDEAEATEGNGNGAIPGTLKRTSSLDEPEAKRMASQLSLSQGSLPLTPGMPSAGTSPGLLVTPKIEPGATKPIERAHADAILNFLLRLACQVNDATTTQGSPGEQLSRRCVALLKMALKPDVWPQSCDLKLGWLDKVFGSVDTPQPNYGNICTALELVTFLLGVMKREQILASFRPLQKGLGACIGNSNTKVIRFVTCSFYFFFSVFIFIK